jgi:Predicted AAA-ATPase/PD-(D/E)XK nuclease superfamily
MDMIEKFLAIEVDQQGNLLPIEQRNNNKLFIGGEIDLGFGETKKLKPLKISSDAKLMKRQGQFPVISISFKDVKGANYQEIVEGVKNQITKTYGRYKYLEQYLEKDNNLLTANQKEQLTKYFNGQLDNINLKNGLRFLSEILFKHFGQKSYILIDEYNTPINSAYITFGDKLDKFKKITELFGGIFGSALKDNDSLEKGMITRILRIAKANLFSDLNNVTEYTLLDREFTKSYGFTQEEVDILLQQVVPQTDSNEIKNWYNGYTFGGEVIYNPWSIMQCLAHKGKLDHYWLDSGGTGLIDKALLSDEMQKELQELLEGKGIVKKLYKQISLSEIENNTDIFYSLLVFAGYLNPCLANDDEEYPRYRLTIPNKEVRNIYVERVISWVTNKLNIKVSDYDDFVGLLTDQKIDKFKQKFSEYLMNSTSYHDLIKEKDYHNLIGGILAPLTRGYIIESNRESGHGRFDHMLIPRENRGNSAIIIEYKVSETTEDLISTARIGLNQIINRHYDTKIKEYQHVKNIIKIAMAFCGKEVKLQYQIDSIIR